MADFYNLINARIERSGRNKKEKEKEIEKVDQLFLEENDNQSPIPSNQSKKFSGNLDLDSFIIGDEEPTKKSSTPNSNKNDYLSQELGKEFEDKDYFKEINEFDFLSLEKIPLKNQNRVLRNEYLEMRGVLSRFNDEMNEKNRKLRTFAIESESLKKQHKMMKDTIRLIASMLPDGSELKIRLDTNNWKIEDVKDALVESLTFVTNRVRNTDEFVKSQLGGMEETISKYKKVLAMQENEKNLLSQENESKDKTITDLNIKIKELENTLLKMDTQLKNLSAQALQTPVESEEEKLKRERLELLRKKEQELLELKKQIEDPSFSFETTSTSPYPTKEPTVISNQTPTPTTNNEITEPTVEKDIEVKSINNPSNHSQQNIHKKNVSEMTPSTDNVTEPVLPNNKEDSNKNNIIPKKETLQSNQTQQQKTEKETINLEISTDIIHNKKEEPTSPVTQEVNNEIESKKVTLPEEIKIEEVKAEEPEIKKTENIITEPISLNPDSDDFDIDAILEQKLKIKNGNSTNEEENEMIPNNKNSTDVSNLETQSEKIIIPVNIEEHIRVLNDKRKYIIKIIAEHGFVRNQEISDFIEKDPEGIRIFSAKGNFQKQEVTNTTRGLADSEYLSVQRVEMGGRNGHNFKVYELTNMGKAVYKHLFNKIPVTPESEILKAQHASLEHGFLIKETIYEFQKMGYKVYSDRKDCRYDLPTGEHKIFDLVLEKDGHKQMIEVERGTHTEKDFFKAMNKIYEITKEFYFVCPNDTVWFDKTRRLFYLWLKKEMGGAQDPKIKGIVTVYYTTLGTLKKEPKPKTVWKDIKF